MFYLSTIYGPQRCMEMDAAAAGENDGADDNKTKKRKKKIDIKIVVNFHKRNSTWHTITP